MISHTVLFRLRRPVEAQAREALLDGLRGFAAEPPHATGPASVVADLGLRGETPRGSDAMLQASFPDADAFAAYLVHERHQALLRDVLEPSCEGWWSVQAEV
jgi:stress responsive alpha/beta barrel protein